MAFTFSYLACNGVQIAAGASDLEVTVSKMNNNYSYDVVIDAQVVSAGGTYNLSYSEDGVYKISVLEDGTLVPSTYADINYCTYLGTFGTWLKEASCCTKENCDEEAFADLINLGLLGFRFFADNTYTPATTTDFTDTSVIAGLQKIHDSIQRSARYMNASNLGTILCCTS